MVTDEVVFTTTLDRFCEPPKPRGHVELHRRNRCPIPSFEDLVLQRGNEGGTSLGSRRTIAVCPVLGIVSVEVDPRKCGFVHIVRILEAISSTQNTGPGTD